MDIRSEIRILESKIKEMLDSPNGASVYHLKELLNNHAELLKKLESETDINELV